MRSSLPMEIREVIGWNVRKNRVKLGLSQERLALEASIDRAYVGRIERGRENVTVAVLESLARVLKIEVATLFVVPTEPTMPLPSLRPGPKSKDG